MTASRSKLLEKIFCGMVCLLTVAVLTGCVPVSAINYATTNDVKSMQGYLDEGGDPNAANSMGITPLMETAASGSYETAKLLIDSGANINQTEKKGYAAISFSIVKKHNEITTYLLERGANPNLRSNNGELLLNEAAFQGNLTAVKELIKHGAKVDITDSRLGVSAIYYAAGSGHTEIVETLIKEGANVNIRSSNNPSDPTTTGVSPLAVAIDNGHFDIAELLLNNGADPNVHFDNGGAILHRLAIKNKPALAKLLLDHGGDVNIRNNIGTTPLMFATGHGHIEMVKLLLEYNADPTIVQSDGTTPLLIAESRGYVTIAELIRSALAGKAPSSKPKMQSPSSLATYTGTGWVTIGGYIVTNYHVIENHLSIKVRFNSLSDKEYSAKAVVSDKSNDLAILKLDDGPDKNMIPGLPIPSTFPNLGEDVFTLGYPKSSVMGKNPKVTDGIVSALSGIQDDPTVMQISVPIQSGNSGGPLMNLKGDVVGVTTASLRTRVTERGIDVPQNVNYAVKTAYVSVLLASLPIDNDYPMVKVSGNKLVDIVPQVKNSIAHIIVEARP